MIEDLLSLRAMVVSPERSFAELFERAAALSVVPAEIVDGADIISGAPGRGMPGRTDLVYLDGTLPLDHATRVVAVLRRVPQPPFITLLAGETSPAVLDIDGVAERPSRIEEAKWLLDRSLRIRLASRVLLVDDSSVMRAIVRKTLIGTRFSLDISETDTGSAAIKLVHEQDFDVVFLDQNMPDVSGLETLDKIRRDRPNLTIVLMTSMENHELAAQVRALGAAFLKKPFFPADIENVLCGFYGLRAVNPKRS